MATYTLPDYVAKPKPRLDHRGFREQGRKAADERIKKLRGRLSWLEGAEEQLKTEQQRLCTSATRELDETVGLHHSSVFNKDVNQEELKELIPKVVDQLNKTRSTLMKETNDIQDLGGKQSYLPRDVSSMTETRKQSLMRKQRRKRSAILNKKSLDEDLRNLQSELKALEGIKDEVTPSEDQKGKEVDRAMSQRIHESEADLIFKIQKKTHEIQSWQEKINKLKKGIEKLSQQNKEDDKKIEKEEERADEDVKLSTERKEQKERQEIKDQETRKKNLHELEKSILSMRARPNTRFDLLSREHFRRHRHRLRLAQMLELDWLEENPYRSRLESRLMMMEEQSDFSDESTDTETQKKVNENCIRWLERQIGNAQNFEQYIETLQHHRQKMEGLESLKHVLRSEMFLEQEWLNLGASTSLELSGSASSTPSHDKGHLFQGYLPDDEIYSPLESGEFRVLILLPTPDPCFPLVCKLEKWSMNEAANSVATGQSSKKQYLALSYFWGPDICNGRIYLLSEDDQDIPSPDDLSSWGTAVKRATRIRIRNNLFRAILRLRRHGADAQAVAIWIDFLSIKQKDVKEKTAQLGRMVDIYSNASQVCIWLGETDSRGLSDDAMDFIPTIMDFAMLERYARDKTQARKWYALGELMRDRWFSRRWVVQEMALAKDATVHCGDRAVRWSDFADAVSLLVSNQEMIKSLFDFSDWREGKNTLGAVESFGAWILLESTSNLFRRKPNGEIKKPIKSIEYLVTSLKTFDTGDTRDLIYSLVSIASDTSSNIWHHDKGNDEGEILVMDYDKSEVAVYQDFTKFCVRSSKSLDVICRPWAMPSERKGIMPSWIPLLAKSEFGEPEEIYTGRKNGDNLIGTPGSPNYEASGKSQCDAVFETQAVDLEPFEAEILVAKGFKLAKVNALSHRNTGGVILRESLEMMGWEGFQRDSNSVPSGVWRTLVADRDLDGRVAPSWYQRACLRCLEIAHMFNNGDLNIGEILQGHSDMLVKYLKRVQNVTWNRRFFTAVGCESLINRHTDQTSVQMSLSGSPLPPGDGEEEEAEEEEQSEAGNVREEEGEVQRSKEKQYEAEHDGTPNRNGTSDGTDCLVTGKHGTDEQQTGGGDDEEVDDHPSAGHEAVMPVIGEKVEDQESSDDENSDEKDDREVSGQTVDVEKSENGKVDGGKASVEASNGETEDGDVNHEEGDDERKEDNEEDEESDSQQSNDEESVQGESSEPDMSDNVVAAGLPSESEDSDVEGYDSEGSASSQDYMTILGLCPPETQDGDFICILYGCSVPVVLRETPDKKRMILIGEAYAHGKMDGEAMEDVPERNLETFYIQ
ncbi:hypothetical protein HG530_003966 [Fusarium avenaceum]|nr:hypothetical protein HG530_003966 [Fusarium avenaceum]